MATALFSKLNFKEQKEILILNPPAEFNGEIDAIKQYTAVKLAAKDSSTISFALIFVQSVGDLNAGTKAITKKLLPDALLWFAYPKGSSKKYKASINRDRGWELLLNMGYDAVRAVAIDEDWSALRFRKTEFIKRAH